MTAMACTSFKPRAIPLRRLPVLLLAAAVHVLTCLGLELWLNCSGTSASLQFPGGACMFFASPLLLGLELLCNPSRMAVPQRLIMSQHCSCTPQRQTCLNTGLVGSCSCFSP